MMNQTKEFTFVVHLCTCTVGADSSELRNVIVSFMTNLELNQRPLPKSVYNKQLLYTFKQLEIKLKLKIATSS